MTLTFNRKAARLPHFRADPLNTWSGELRLPSFFATLGEAVSAYRSPHPRVGRLGGPRVMASGVKCCDYAFRW